MTSDRTVEITVRQLKYMGGGHPGCGGYVEALAVEPNYPPMESRYVMQEHRSDQTRPPQRWRWREYPSEEDLLVAWKQAWNLVNNEDGWSEWQAKRPW